MCLRLLACSACIFLGSAVLPAPVAAQEQTAAGPSAELLTGVGVGHRENNWSNSREKPTLKALVLMVAFRAPARHLLNVEAELGWWEEETARFGTPPSDVAAITTHILTFGPNLFLMPRVGRFRPRAGIGLHLTHHFDTGTHPMTETHLGGNASVGAELALSPRLGAYALIRTEAGATASGSLSRVYGGVRVGL